MSSVKFPECDSCINLRCDPFQCADCKNRSNYEGEDDVEELSVAQFKDLFGDVNDA